MMRTPTDVDKSTATYKAALWIWTIVVTIGTGIAFGNVFGGGDYYTEPEFSGGAFVGGLLVGAFSTIPFWALLGVAGHVLRNVIALREDLAAGSEAAPAPTAPPQPAG